MANINITQENLIKKLKKNLSSCIPIKISKTIAYCLLRNWLFQGVALMHWTELLFRETLELFLIIILWFILSNWFGPFIAGILSFLLVHTLMWTFNGHIWALKISENVRLIKNTPERIKGYIAGLEQRLDRAGSITACVFSGSLTRGQFHQYSDLDVWFTKRRGFLNGLWAYALGVRERNIAFLQKIPIELSFYDPDDYAGKDMGETLLLLKDVEGRWKNVEPSSIYLRDYPLNEMEFFSRN